MKHKNSITIKNKNGESQIAGLSTPDKWAKVRYGRNYDADAVKAIRALHHALYMKGSPPRLDEMIFAQYRDEFWNYVAKGYEEGLPKNDGKFFRKLADAMEVCWRPVNPAHSVIGGRLFNYKEGDTADLTISEAIDLCKKAGIPKVSSKTVGRIFESYGVKPTLVKRGVKPGSKPGAKRKSVHRVAGIKKVAGPVGGICALVRLPTFLNAL